MLPARRGSRGQCLLVARCVCWSLIACSAAAAAAACRSDVDCQLAGACTPGGGCACDVGWRGARCETLDLAPAPFGPARQALEQRERASWGGNSVRGGADPSRWHLFAAEMAAGGLHGFKGANGSQLVRGESAAGPAGPFTRREVLHAPLAHNPQPYAFANGSVCLFMIATPFNGNNTDNTTARFPFKLTVGCAPDALGPWEWVQPLLLGLDGAAIDVDNPSAVFHADGSVTLVTRGIALFRSGGGWRGPYAMLRADLLPAADLSEDPFLWRSPRGWHMLLHDHQPFAFHKQAIVHAYTADPAGLDGWVFDNTTVAASGTGVRFDDGSTHTFCSRQRPQLSFGAPPDADGLQAAAPTLLFTGVQHGLLSEKGCGGAGANSSEFNPFFDYSFTFAQPFAQQRAP